MSSVNDWMVTIIQLANEYASDVASSNRSKSGSGGSNGEFDPRKDLSDAVKDFISIVGTKLDSIPSVTGDSNGMVSGMGENIKESLKGWELGSNWADNPSGGLYSVNIKFTGLTVLFRESGLAKNKAEQAKTGKKIGINNIANLLDSGYAATSKTKSPKWGEWNGRRFRVPVSREGTKWLTNSILEFNAKYADKGIQIIIPPNSSFAALNSNA